MNIPEYAYTAERYFGQLVLATAKQYSGVILIRYQATARSTLVESVVKLGVGQVSAAAAATASISNSHCGDTSLGTIKVVELGGGEGR